MVVKPSDCVDPTEEEARMIANAEAQIDAHLQKSYGRNGTNRVTFQSSTFTSNHAVRQRLVAMYEAAGWNVKYTSDQRDGDYYTFTKAS